MTIKEALYEGFGKLPTRQGRGGTYAYVRWQDIADRMNTVFGVNWSSEVVNQDVVNGNVIIRVRVLATNPETGQINYQEGFGGAILDERVEAGNPFKAAYSKALKDACKKWGVALYLDEEGEGPSYGTEPSGGMIPPGYSGHEIAPAPKTQPSPQTQPQSGGMPMPPGVSMSTPNQPSNQAPQQTNEPLPQAPPPPKMPSTPAPSAPPVPQNSSFGESMNKVPSFQQPGQTEDLISDVQKAALNSILSRQGVDYETLVREAFETNGLDGKKVPAQDELTYTQAVYVVKYGNDKFRIR